MIGCCWMRAIVASKLSSSRQQQPDQHSRRVAHTEAHFDKTRPHMRRLSCEFPTAARGQRRWRCLPLAHEVPHTLSVPNEQVLGNHRWTRQVNEKTEATMTQTAKPGKAPKPKPIDPKDKPTRDTREDPAPNPDSGGNLPDTSTREEVEKLRRNLKR